MTRTIAILLLLMCFFACQPAGTIYEEHQELSDNIEWRQNDPRTFVIPIKDNSKPLQFILNFRYATGFQFDHMRMRITETDPDGNRTIRDAEFRIRDENGEFLGDAGYDIIDLEYILDENKQYPVLGDYTYVVEHNMPTDPLHYAMEVGLSLREK